MKAPWDSFWSLESYWRCVALAYAVFVVLLTVMIWRVRISMLFLAALVAADLRHARGGASLYVATRRRFKLEIGIGGSLTSIDPAGRISVVLHQK